MDHLKNFLEKFKKIRNPKEDRLKLIEQIKLFLGHLDLDIDIDYKRDVIVLKKTNPTIRSIIYLNKEAIISQIKSNLRINISDIK